MESGTHSSKLPLKIHNPAGISPTKSNYLLESIGPDATERSVWQYVRENKIGKDRERMKQALKLVGVPTLPLGLLIAAFC